MKKKLLAPALIVIAILLSVAVFIFSGYLHNPFAPALELVSPSLVTEDSSGNTYIIDSSLMRVVRLNSAGQVTLTINGGDRNFSYAENIAADDYGYIYLSDTVLSDNMITVSSERILRFRPDGRLDSVVFEIPYSGESAPKMNGGISGLEFTDGTLRFALRYGDTIAAYQAQPGEPAQQLFEFEYAQSFVYFEDIRVSPALNGLMLTRKDGGIWFSDASGLTNQLYAGHDDTGDGVSLPFEAAYTADGGVAFTDTACRKVKYLTPAQVQAARDGTVATDAQVILDRRNLGQGSVGASPIYTRLNVYGNVLCLTDTFAAMTAGLDGAITAEVYSAPVSLTLRLMYALTWLALAVSVGLVVLAIALLMRGRPHHAMSALFHKGLLIAVVTLFSSAIVCTIMITSSNSQLNGEVLQSIATITQMASDFVNGDALEKLDSITDFHNDDYNKLKTQLDSIMKRSFAWGANPYYLIYMTDGDTVYRVMDYADFVSCYAPMDTAYEGSYYQQVMESGEQQVYDSIADSTGVWTLAVGPIYNSAGETVAVIEIGRNLHALTIQQRAVIMDVIRNVVAMVITLMMIYTELLYVFDMRRRQRELRALPVQQRRLGIEIVRPLVFMLLIADYMQNGFEPIYVRQIYTSIFGLPESIGAAIPLTSEVVSTAIFAVIAGNLRGRLGIRKMITGGVVLGGCGIILRGLASGVPVFMLGKIITGAGMGCMTVALSTFIAERQTEDEVNRGYAAYFAASLAAINVGIVVGSYLAEFVGYKYVYIISGTLMLSLGAIVLASISGSFEPEHKPLKTAIERARISFVRFFFDRRVFALQLLMFVPYLIMSYFLYYFYPLFAADMGISDTAIGQTFLINGLCVTYIGPLITPPLLRALGARMACILGAALYVGGILLFAFNPTIISALECILLMGIADSFSFSAMTTFFTSTKAVALYGESRSSGIKSTMENTGYTLAPFAYGAAMIMGSSAGLIAMAAIFAALVLLFFVLTAGGRRRSSVDAAQDTSVDN